MFTASLTRVGPWIHLWSSDSLIQTQTEETLDLINRRSCE